MANLRDFRLADLVAFVTVHQCGSVSGASRQLHVTPSQVSKAITRLEALLSMQLVSRSSRGVKLTDGGRHVLPRIQRIMDELEQLRPHDDDDGRTLAIAAPSYLNDILIPRISAFSPRLRVRALELSPALVRTYAGDNIVDAVLMAGEINLPQTWSVSEVGVIEKCLFASPKLAARLGNHVEASQLRDIPFVTPISGREGRFILLDDDCPLGQNRRTGHEVYTIGLGLQMAAVSDQLVFGPRVAARSYLARGDLVEVRVQDWDEREPVHFACHIDRVQAAEEKFIIDAVRNGLSAH